MTDQEAINQIEKLLSRIVEKYGHPDPKNEVFIGEGIHSEVVEFVKVVVGVDSLFYRKLSKKRTGIDSYTNYDLFNNLTSLKNFIQDGVRAAISPTRTAQFETMSDILDQADRLLNEKDIHPAAAATIIGATLEEFLRNWISHLGLSIGSNKPGINSYADCLRQNSHLDKQDIKEITYWAGLRNDAAHGDWDNVKDRQRIRIMLEGVNLFLSRHGAPLFIKIVVPESGTEVP